MAEAALAAVEAAITEVTKARKLVTQKQSKQISSADERDQLKAVAFAWLESHRLVVGNHRAKLDLTKITGIYSSILEATAGHATRRTYSNALAGAKTELVLLRGQLAAAAPSAASSSPDSPPNFAPLATDALMQNILQRRWHEVQLCMACDANLAATVMMGGLLESLLLARMNSSPNLAAVYTAKLAPRDKSGKTLAFGEWKLTNMIEVSHELKWVTKSAKEIGNVLREFRNYIHPHKEFTDKVTIQAEDTKMFWEVTKSITRQVLSSVGSSP